ncbi:MAG: sigma-70 family RNA polymerase sigma factor [Isosphaeraceae bacterium]|nr:sigma-70 family RNA polymerase sigma factor [Isosphaeraceae bacterium]
MALTADGPRRITDDLIARAAGGDESAWSEIFESSYPKIRRSIRRRMSPHMRRRLDSTDIANSVMKDVIAKFGKLEFESKRALEAFLIRAAEQKLIDEHRRQTGLKRDIQRERPGDAALVLADREPTPSQTVSAQEELNSILEVARSPIEREVVLSKIDGDSTEAIADRTGLSPRGIQRLLQRIRKSLAL